MSTRWGTSDYNFKVTKPANNDGLGVFDTAGNELKSMTFTVFKNFFVMKDEAANITASHEIQTNYNLYFGNSAEARLIYDGTDMILGTTAVAATAKLKLRCNALDFLTLDPVNSSIKIGTKAINYDGSAGEGLNFDTSNRPVLLSILQMNAGIATKTKNISYSGAASTGLEFSAVNVGTFNQGVLMLSTLGVSGQITASYASAYSLQAEGPCYFKGNLRCGTITIGYDGVAGHGLSFEATHKATFSHDLDTLASFGAGTAIQAGTNIIALGSYIRSYGYVRADTVFNCNGTSGITATINTGTNPTLTVKGGIITAYA